MTATRCVILPAILLIVASAADAAVIPVNATVQTISATGGCSLQEAVYSANFDDNVAISGYTADGTPIVVRTDCVPGSGDDVVVLPAGATLSLSRPVDDADNPTGPTATPIITSTITILAYGATLQRTGTANFRLFAVDSTGRLTIRRAHIKGFKAQGGNGRDGAGGGMGAGGAIYVRRGGLAIESSTFEGNQARGGLGGPATGLSGGGGGIGGDGAPGQSSGEIGGGGGGGARGHGAAGRKAGGGGGGTLRNGGGSFPYLGGFNCGGQGGAADDAGDSAPCPGGGGGGGGGPSILFGSLVGHEGGKGSYGGGGGGGDLLGGGHGGHGGFGGGGGASGSAGAFGEDGGNGGFGGGGGAGDSGGALDPGVNDPGDGGFFGGNANSRGGGGGAGLGGAIFNDGGVVDVRNSTFAGNVGDGGLSQETQDGSGGGGAIFSVDGRLVVQNSTISGNVARFGGGIMVAQDSETAPTSFVLQNTIVAGNSLYDCAITGHTIGVAFAGNLIQNNVPDDTEFHRETFVGCGGVVTTSDPQLGPLQLNGGVTPTKAIGSTSPAWNAADPATSLAQDQRRQDRPAMGGFDIGAFELCVEGVGPLQHPCPILVGVERPDQTEVQLTMQVLPAGGGTTSPAPGTHNVLHESVISVTATPSTGFRFMGWSPNVTAPGSPSTTVFMDTSQLVTANFAPCACATDVSASVSVVRGPYVLNAVTRRYAQTVTLTNTSTASLPGPISLVLDNLASTATLYNATGVTQDVLPAGRPYINSNTTLAPGQSVSITLQFSAANTGAISYDTRVLAGPGSR